MTIRCKFKVVNITDAGSTESLPIKRVHLTTQYDESIPEDRRFTQWTPTGDLTFVCTNPAVLDRLAAAGVELIDRQPRRGLHDWLIAFVHPRACAGVLTELVDRASVE